MPWDTPSLKQSSLLTELAPQKPFQALPSKNVGITEDFDTSTRNLYAVIIIICIIITWISLRKAKWDAEKVLGHRLKMKGARVETKFLEKY